MSVASNPRVVYPEERTVKTRTIYRLLGAALLLGICPGCFVSVEDKNPKPGVDVKIDRTPGKGIDVDVDVNAPK